MVRLLLRACTLSAAVLAVTVHLLASVAEAGVVTFTVNSNGDADDATFDGVCATATGVCTLRAALQEASHVTSPDSTQIVVPPMTIVLGRTLDIYPFRCETNHFCASVTVTITGAGREQTILDGNGADPALLVTYNNDMYSIANASGTLRHLTIRNGKTGARNYSSLVFEDVTLEGNTGRAIVNSDYWWGPEFFVIPSLSLTDVLIRNNAGGAIWNGSRLTGVNVTILDNSATYGAALYNDMTYELSQLNGFLMSGNTATFGGAVYAHEAFASGLVTLKNGVIRDNTAVCCAPGTSDSGGGGIFVDYDDGEGRTAEVTLTDVTLSGNRATSAGSFGGAIANRAKVNLTRVSVTGNEATFGGGIFNGNFATKPGSMWLTNVTVSGNVATAGGGVYNTSNGKLSVTNSTIAQNSAAVSGGIENVPSASYNDVNLRNTILANNTATASSSPDCRGAIGSGGSNIVRDTSGCLFFATVGDQTGVDPKLEVLRGSPAYHPLRLNSPAFQTGNNAFCPSTDQRGLARPQGGVCDKGAYEIGDVPVVGDWDGNGTVTIGVYRPWEHAWYLRNSITSGVNDVPVIFYGTDGDYPVAGDWDGDGVDTIGVYRPSEHMWYLRNSNTSGMNDVPAIQYGTDADYPVVGDWNGDGVDTIGVYRPPEHVWYLRDFNSSGYNTVPAILYGVDGDLPVVGDWNGDLMDTIGVFRPSERVWYLRDENSSGFNTVPAILYGDGNDLPVTGDWNGDDTTTIGVYRLPERVWYLRNANSSGTNDIPAILF